MVRVFVEFNFSDFNVSEEQTNRIVKKTLDLTQTELLRNLSINSPVDTGRLQGSWMHDNQGLVRKIFTSTIYADFLDKGTGVYGPKRKPITPKKGKALKFRAGGKIIYRKSVKGIKPQHFVKASINSTKSRIQEFAIKAIQEA